MERCVAIAIHVIVDNWKTITFDTHLGGVPRDGPIPEVQSDNPFEIVIAASVTSLGIASNAYFFLFNIYYRKHL